jgi:hypothetical protein
MPQNINSAVMKIRLFKPKNILEYRKYSSQWKPQFTGSLLPEGNNLHNHRSPTCGQRRSYHYCLKGRTLAVVQMNIHTGKKRTLID